MSLPKIYVSTIGYNHNDAFYPANIGSDDTLKYYSSVFDSVLLDHTYVGQPFTTWYTKILDDVKENDSFKFIITAPKLLAFSDDTRGLWTYFWDGVGGRGGCKYLHESGKLGCVLIQLPKIFEYIPENVEWLSQLQTIIPPDVRCAFEFLDYSWQLNIEDLREIFDVNESWGFTTPLLENHLINKGWAGNMPTTRIYKTPDQEEVYPVFCFGGYVMINLYGTLGRCMGSYDKESFLENLIPYVLDNISGRVDTLYFSFNNNLGTYCFPLPEINLFGKPKLASLSEGESDLVCCLHDALKLKKIVDADYSDADEVVEIIYV